MALSSVAMAGLPQIAFSALAKDLAQLKLGLTVLDGTEGGAIGV